MNYTRVVAGVFAGTGALLLIWRGYVTEGCLILSTMLGFFVGEHNGEKKAAQGV